MDRQRWTRRGDTGGADDSRDRDGHAELAEGGDVGFRLLWFVLLYNGILHDRSVNGGNVLTRQTLVVIKEDIGRAARPAPPRVSGTKPDPTVADGTKPIPPELPYRKLVVYGKACRLGDSRLAEEKIEFRQTLYDVVTIEDQRKCHEERHF